MIRIARSQNSVRRVKKVGHGTAFTHELRVITNREALSAPLAAFSFQDREHHRFGGSSQNRAAQDKHVWRLLLPDGRANLPRHVLDVAKIELAIFQAGRSDADKRYLRIQYRRSGIGRRM